jgi:hypothetical protein
VRSTACRAGEIVADSEKGRLKFLFAAIVARDLHRAHRERGSRELLTLLDRYHLSQI